MPVNLSIKNAPDRVVQRLREWAERHHRSLQGELLAIIKAAVADTGPMTPAEILAEVRRQGLQTSNETITSNLPPNSVAAPVSCVPKGHDAWATLATAPEGVTLAREEGRLAVEEFQDVIRRSDLNRPVDDVSRLAAMLAHANLIVTARDEARHLIGVARSLTDFAYCCYLSDLCVDKAWQGRGIGRAMVAETKRIVGRNSMVLLLSASRPMTYYPRIGMETVQNGFIIRREG